MPLVISPAPTCSECGKELPLWRAEDSDLYCCGCWVSWFGCFPPPGLLVRERCKHPRAGLEQPGAVAHRKDRPWVAVSTTNCGPVDVAGPPLLTTEQELASHLICTAAAVASAAGAVEGGCKERSSSPLPTAQRQLHYGDSVDGNKECDLLAQLTRLCKEVVQRASRLHCDEIARIARALSPLDAKSCSRQLALRTFLDTTAKSCQPCHASSYAAPASELQMLGLAHGDEYVERHIREVTAHISLHRDARSAVDQIWVLLTAKVPDQRPFEAAESIDIDNAPADAVVALICALATAGAGRNRKEWVQRLAQVALTAASAGALPAHSLTQLSRSLSQLDALSAEIAESLSDAALKSGLHTFSSEDLTELVVAITGGGAEGVSGGRRMEGVLRFLDTVAEEVLSRLAGDRVVPLALLCPGVRVRLRSDIGHVAAGATGVLSEFVLSVGCWRVFLDGGGGGMADVPVDVRHDNLEVLDGGMRSTMCCHECWKLDGRLHRMGDGSLYCLECCEIGSDTGRSCELATEAVTTETGLGIRGTCCDLFEDDGPISAREAARLCCAFSLVGSARPLDVAVDALCAVAERCRQRAIHEKPFKGNTGLSTLDSVAKDAPEVPVLVVNLDRSPHRLQDMAREVQRAGVRGRRFPAIDGRHRVVRRSSAKPVELPTGGLASPTRLHECYYKDLPDFALRWDESRPAMGLAMTADRERHFVGYVGSWLSHMHALRHAFEEGFPYVVVLEDDQVLSPNFNSVVRDIIDCAGDRFDVVILGSLDWRMRSLRYAQARKVMQLRLECTGACRTEEELHLANMCGIQLALHNERTHFLYSIGCKAMGGDDYMSTGCSGVWGYLVSRKGLQKMQCSMKVMWESIDDVLQAELQGDNRFTEAVGNRRLWAVWPPIVSSDGKWPSQNSGEDLDMGRQEEAVSPHASFRDPSLQTPMAQLVLSPELSFLDSGPPLERGVHCEGVLTLAAVTSLLLPAVEPIWAYAQSSWRQLFDQRNGAGGGFELRTELQLRLHTDKRLFDIATEGLTWSWTLLRAAYLFGLCLPSPVMMHTEPPEGPPTQLLPLAVHIINAPDVQLNLCPDAWFHDFTTVAQVASITCAVDGANSESLVSRDLVSELEQHLPRALLRRTRLAYTSQPAKDLQGLPGRRTLALAAGVRGPSPGLLATLCAQLKRGAAVVVTGYELAPLLDVLAELSDMASSGDSRPYLAFAGSNPFGSCLRLPAGDITGSGASTTVVAAREKLQALGTGGDGSGVAVPIMPGVRGQLKGLPGRPELDGRDALVVSRLAVEVDSSGPRWRMRIAGGEEVEAEPQHLVVEEPEAAWPPGPRLGEAELTEADAWRAARARMFCEALEPAVARLAKARPPSTNAYWLGLFASESGIGES